ncbi:MAG: hypothetical protein D6740_02370 [Alphaproteobacteria bacterium]|nr:MAG: hypothetical protein D6740_02370 [Alphaproteobacteria bacterium]
MRIRIFGLLLAGLMILTPAPLAARDREPMTDARAFALASRAYALAATGRIAEAVTRMRAALSFTGRPHRRAQWARDLGQWLERLGRDEDAAGAYRLAGELDGDAWSFKAAGYAFLRAGRPADALAAFRRATASARNDPVLWQEIGYLEKRLHHPRRAERAFAQAMAVLDGLPADAPARRDRPLLARERMFLADRWQGAVEVIWRADSPETAPVILSERSLTQSQISARISYPLGLHLSGPVRVFARVLAGTEGRGLLPKGRTVQAGLGLRWQPLPEENLVLAVERLVAIGRFARNDFLVRAAWSRGSNWLPDLDGRHPHRYWSVYLDAALIDPADPDLLGNAQLRLGRQWFWGERILRATVALTAFGQRDDFGTVTLLQGEPQLELLWPLTSLAGPKPLTMLAFTISFQKKILGSSRNNRGLSLQLGLRF